MKSTNDNYSDSTWGGDPRAPWNQDLPGCAREYDCEDMPDGYLECPLRFTCDWYKEEK